MLRHASTVGAWLVVCLGGKLRCGTCRTYWRNVRYNIYNHLGVLKGNFIHKLQFVWSAQTAEKLHCMRTVP